MFCPPSRILRWLAQTCLTLPLKRRVIGGMTLGTPHPLKGPSNTDYLRLGYDCLLFRPQLGRKRGAVTCFFLCFFLPLTRSEKKGKIRGLSFCSGLTLSDLLHDGLTMFSNSRGSVFLILTS